MKILFIHNRYLQSLGGEDATVDAEIALLTQKGHEISTLYFTNEQFGGSLLKKIQAGAKTVYNSASAKRVHEAIRQFSPDIIHVHNFYFEASPAVFDVAYKSGVPVVATVQNYRLVCVNALLLRQGQVCEACVHSFFPWKGVLHKCYHHSYRDSLLVGMIAAAHKLTHTWNKKIDRFITPSEFARQRLLNSSLHLAENKIVVKRNFLPDPGQGLVKEKGTHYLFVGRLSAEKGVPFLLSCFAAMPHEKLIVAGDGPDEALLQQQFGHLENIIFKGRQPKEEVLRLMKSCRALLFPSIWYEGLPVTIVEAFATGTPVIASRLGAMQEMVQHNHNGLLFDVNDAAGLQQALSTLNSRILNGDYSLYEGARQSYTSLYHPEACYQAVMEIYRAVLQEHRKTPAQTEE